MKIHLIDGTYELFRSFYGPPPKKAPDGREVGATIGLLRSLLALLGDPDVTHIGCAFDHVVELFRNDLFPGYKTGEGIDPDLRAQFPLAEEAVAALGIVVWPMVEFEADDAIATAAVRLAEDPAVEQVVICSPDKDLAQLVSGSRIVCWDRRREMVYDEDAVIEKYGVAPSSIPDWLALVGDSADGIPGIPAWGAKSAATILSEIWTHRSHPGRHRAVGTVRRPGAPAGRKPHSPQGAGVPVPPSDHAAHGRAADSKRGRSEVARRTARVEAALSSAGG